MTSIAEVLRPYGMPRNNAQGAYHPLALKKPLTPPQPPQADANSAAGGQAEPLDPLRPLNRHGNRPT